MVAGAMLLEDAGRMTEFVLGQVTFLVNGVLPCVLFLSLRKRGRKHWVALAGLLALQALMLAAFVFRVLK